MIQDSMLFRVRWLTLFAVFILSNGFLFTTAHFFQGGTLSASLSHSGTLVGKMVGIVLLFLLASALGMRLLKLFRSRLIPESMKWAFALGLGMAAFGLGMFGLAATHQAKLPVIVILLSLATYSAWREVHALIHSIFQKTISVTFTRSNAWLWLLWLFLFAILEFEFISSLATLMHADYDAFHQYLTFPMEYFRQGGLTTFLWHPGWGFPQFGEMLFLLAALLFGLHGPFLFNYCFLLVLLTLLFQAMYSVTTPWFRHWLIACIISSPTILGLGAGGLKIELIFFTYFLLTILLVRHGMAENDPVPLGSKQKNILFGFFLGILLSIKYTSFFLIGAIFTALWVISKHKWEVFKQSVGVMSVATLIFSPWLIKNWIAYRSPLYPILEGRDEVYLQTGHACSHFFREYAAHDTILLFSKDVYQTGWTLLDNLQIFLFSVTHSSMSGQFPGIWATVCVVVALISVFSWKQRSASDRFLILFSIAFFMGWVSFLLGAMWYFFPSWIALLLLLSQLPTAGRINAALRYAIIIAAIIGISSALFLVVPKFGAAIQYANDDISLREVRDATRGSDTSLRMYDRINALLRDDPVARVYSFQEPQGYFIDDSSKRFIIDYYGEKLQCFGDNASARASLKALGVKYIYADLWRTQYCNEALNPEANQLCQSLHRFESFIQEEAPTVIMSEEGMILYRL